MSELTPEDSLRLNVMLAGDIHAIRIDATNMTVYGLSSRGVASVKLHPTGRSDQYLRTVKEILATHAIGSPSGYPAYVQHWSRMGQARDHGLDRLLLLGDPEAVTSVAYSPGLTAELARRAWWAHPVADHARGMLERECVAQDEIGKVLADFLFEHLPFENEAHVIMRTVRVLLQPGLTDEEARLVLWRKGLLDNAYQAGFISRLQDEIPEQVNARNDFSSAEDRLLSLSEQGNIFAQQLKRVLSASGQTFLQAYDKLLRYPADQDVVLVLLEAMSSYFTDLRTQHSCEGESIEIIAHNVALFMANQANDSALNQLLKTAPELENEVRAMLVLSCIDANVATPILAQTTATGSLMRKKLEPLFNPILQQLAVLTGKAFSSDTVRRRGR
jgi:hypothetical protein